MSDSNRGIVPAIVYGHFGPKTFQHYVFGAEMSRIFALVPKCLGFLR